MNYETRFLYALLLTVVVEGSVITAMLRLYLGLKRYRVAWLKVVGAGVIPSVATLPYLWFILPVVIADYHLRILIGETAIVAVEAVILQLLLKLPLHYCAVLSLLANGASILAGLAVFR